MCAVRFGACVRARCDEVPGNIVCLCACVFDGDVGKRGARVRERSAAPRTARSHIIACPRLCKMCSNVYDLKGTWPDGWGGGVAGVRRV